MKITINNNSYNSQSFQRGKVTIVKQVGEKVSSSKSVIVHHMQDKAILKRVGRWGIPNPIKHESFTPETKDEFIDFVNYMKKILSKKLNFVPKNGDYISVENSNQIKYIHKTPKGKTTIIYEDPKVASF